MGDLPKCHYTKPNRALDRAMDIPDIDDVGTIIEYDAWLSP